HGCAVIEGLADFPGTALFLGLALEVATGHVQTDGETIDASGGLLHAQITPAAAQCDHELDLVVKVGCAWRVRHFAGFALGNVQDGIGRLREKERILAAGETHLLGMFGVIAAHAINATYRETGVSAGDRHDRGGLRRKHRLHRSALATVTGSPVDDFLGRGFGAFPALHLDPFALLEILVVLEEVLNLTTHLAGYIVGRTQASVCRVQLVHGYGQQLGVDARFVFHLQHAQRPAAHHGTHLNRERRHDQHVHGVAIVREGLRNETVVARIVHGGQHETINEDGAGGLVHFILYGVRIHGDLDDDVELVRQIVARRHAV